MSEGTKCLLNSISAIVSKYEKQNAISGNSINVFEIAGIETREVRICKVIAFLLNPEEKHYQKERFLNIFLQEIGEPRLFPNEKVAVYTEYATDKRRRIDIVIKSEKRFLPFEVKIYAADQEKQCVDYFQYAKRLGAEKVFYLTPDGHMPGDSSEGNLQKDKELILLSFCTHIVNWLEKCETEVLEINTPLKELLREFKITVMKFSHILEDKHMQKEILDEIIAGKEDAAKAIIDAVNTINYEELWENFCIYCEKSLPSNYNAEYNPDDEDIQNYDQKALVLKVNDIDLDFSDRFSQIYLYCPSKRDALYKQLTDEGYNIVILEDKPNELYVKSFKTESLFSEFVKCDINDKLAVYKAFTQGRQEILNKMIGFLELIVSPLS